MKLALACVERARFCSVIVAVVVLCCFGIGVQAGVFVLMIYDPGFRCLTAL